MLLIIDGHNLIPHMPGLNLSDPDDELQLIQMLQKYCRLKRARTEVFFDRAPVGQAGVQQFGLVQAHFVREGVTADAAIVAYLQKMGRQARNVIVVSSDRQVAAAGRAMHAQMIKAEAFARAWVELADDQPDLDPRDRLLSEDEVRSWELLFRRGHSPQKE